MEFAATLEGLAQAGSPGASADDDLLIPGLDPELVAKMRRLITRAVAEGIDEGAQKVAARYGAAAKWQVGATIACAGLLAAILVVLLVKD